MSLRPLVKLAVPVALAHLANISMQVVDTIFVGKLGPEALGGISIASAVFNSIMIVGVGMLLGLEFVVSRAVGANKHQEANQYLTQALFLSVVVSIPLMLLMFFSTEVFERIGVDPAVVKLGRPYMRVLCWSLLPWLLFTSFRQFLQAHGIAISIFVILVAANIFNAMGNWLLIPHLGVAGSGWATLAARIFMLISIAALHLWRFRKNIFLQLKFSKPRSLELIRLGAPAATQVLLEVGVFATATILAGRLGAIPLASHQIVLQIASFTFMIPMGMASAASIRVAQNLGAGDRCRAVRTGWLGLGLIGGVMACLGLMLYFLSGPLLRIFTSDADVIATGRTLLLVAALFQLSDGVQVVGAGLLRGLGNTRVSMIANLVGHWFFGLPIGVFLCFTLGMGVLGLWIGLSLGLSAVAIALTWLWRSKSKAMI